MNIFVRLFFILILRKKFFHVFFCSIISASVVSVYTIERIGTSCNIVWLFITGKRYKESVFFKKRNTFTADAAIRIGKYNGDNPCVIMKFRLKQKYILFKSIIVILQAFALNYPAPLSFAGNRVHIVGMVSNFKSAGIKQVGNIIPCKI